MLIKKLFRMTAVIVHVLWGAVQVFYYIDAKKGIAEKEKKLIKHWFKFFLQKLRIEKRVHGEFSSINHLMVSNHVSWMDIIVLNSIYETHFIAKSEIRKWPIVGWLSANTGTLFVKRSSMTDARRLNETIAQLLSTGQCITLFPEGGTSNGKQIAKFYPGLFQSALNAQLIVPDAEIVIQPVVISYQHNNQYSQDIPYIDDISLWSNFWMILGLEKITVDVYFTPKIPVANRTRKQLSQQAQQQIQDVLSDCFS